MAISIDLSQFLTNADGSKNSNYPNGDKIKGGNAQLNWSGDQVVGSNITLATDGTYSFGSTAPNFIMLLDAYSAQGSKLEVSDIAIGAGVTIGYQNEGEAWKFDLTNDARLGRGIKMGSTESVQNGTDVPRLEVSHSLEPKFFEARSTYWPAANQANAVPLLDANNSWQIKPIWNMSNFDYNSTDTDIFINSGYAFYNPNTVFKDEITVASNSVQTQYLTKDSSIFDPSDTTYQRPYDEVYFIETAWDQGVADGVTADGSVHVFQTTDTRVLNNLQEGNFILSEPNGPVKKIDSFTYPGFIRGFSIPNNMNFIEGEVYKANGEGANCRVVMTDNADYFLSKKRAYLEPVLWEDSTIQFKWRTGVFQGDLTDAYFNIIGVDNTQIASLKVINS